jgi:polycystin 2
MLPSAFVLSASVTPSLNPQLAETLSASAADLLGFSVMFFIVFLAYAQLGYLVLGPSAAEFHTFEESV